MTTKIATLLLVLGALLIGPGTAGAHVETDVNLLTAIDESASVGRHGEWLQYNGLAKAVRSPEFLDAVLRTGAHGRVGFAIVAWSSHGNVRVILPWMVITSAADAGRAAWLIERAARVDRAHWEDVDETGRARAAETPGHDTDISATIDAAVRLTVAAPFPSERGVINILANGRDNVGRGPQLATRRAVALGLTVNGVVFGDGKGLANYFRDHVIGGRGCFVETVSADPGTFNDMMVRKLLQDLLW